MCNYITIYNTKIVDWYSCFMKHRCSSCLTGPMFVVSHTNRRLKTICDMPKTTQNIAQYSWHSKLYYAIGLVNIYCKLQSITFSHNKTHLDPRESLFFQTQAAGVHKKTTSILMQLICATFRPLFLENICSRLLRNQMIRMLISHFRYILNAPKVFHFIILLYYFFGVMFFILLLFIIFHASLPPVLSSCFSSLKDPNGNKPLLQRVFWAILGTLWLLSIFSHVVVANTGAIHLACILFFYIFNMCNFML